MANSVVDKIAKDKVVEGIIKNVAKDTKDEDLRDLAQDIYLELLEKPENILLCIYERNQIQYYLTRIVLNNVNSKTSRYYYIYKKNKSVTTPIDDANAEKGERADYD